MTELDLDSFNDLSSEEQAKTLFRNQRTLEKKLDKILEQLQDKEVVERDHEENPLNRFEKSRVNEFLRRLRDSGNNGLKYTDLKNIFNRGKSVAYELMDDIPEHNPGIKKIQRGPTQKNIIVQEKNYLIDEIKDLSGSDFEKIVEGFIGEDLQEDPQEVLEDQLRLSQVKKLYENLLSQELDTEEEQRSRAPSWI